MGEHDDLPPLDTLSERISTAREASTPKRLKSVPEAGKSVAFRSGSELIAGVAVGGFLGYYLDEWLGTRPGLTVFGIFLGMAGGVMNIYRAVSVEAKQQEDDALAKTNSQRNSDGT
ncbi:MAG: AtpZ/AtpI family protein [Alphaproteobacteria bacterium]|nr:AtpZ/AtpI family protein [Alphaproteobacteria bacterium]